MTEVEVYDLACTKWKDPAVMRMGDRCIIGVWVSLQEQVENDDRILHSKDKGIRVIGEGLTWKEAVVNAGLVPVYGCMVDGRMPANKPKNSLSFVITPEMAREVEMKRLGVLGTHGLSPQQVRADGPLVLSARRRAAFAAETFMGDNPDLLARLACPTPGCGVVKQSGNPFCPKCFEEHRDAREMHATPPSKE